MTFTATPEVPVDPDDKPRIRLDIDSDDPGAAFTSLVIKRDGALIREQPFVGGPEALAFDYESPFGVPVTYVAEGSFIPTTTPDWTETWASLASWTGSGFSASGGKAVSSTNGAQIVRSASGTIQRVDVSSPDYVRVELLTAGDVVVCSVQVDSKVTLTGTSSVSAAGGGSFALTLSGGTATASAVDSSWSVSRPYTGTPTKVRVVSLYPTVVPDISWSTTGTPEAIALDSTGNVYVTDYTNKLVRKFSALGSEVTTGGFPIATVGNPRALTIDSSGNIYVLDSTNKLVRKFNSSGATGITWSTTGSPYGIAVDSTNNIYVADAQNSLIRKFSATGTAGITFSTVGIPYGVTVDSAGNVYVADYSAKLIRKFNSSGVAGITWSTTGTPDGVGVDSSNNIYVADATSKLVRQYSATGTTGITLAVTGTPEAVTVGSTGIVYVTDYTGKMVRKFVPKTASTDDIVTTLVASEVTYSETASTQLDVTEAWLIHPSQPSLSIAIDQGPNAGNYSLRFVEASSGESKVSQANRTIHNLVGRRNAVVITNGPRAADEWTLIVGAPEIEQKNAVRAIVDDQTPLLLLAPLSFGWDLPDGWYSVGDVRVDRVETPIINTTSLITLPLTPIDDPIVRQGALWTCGDVLLTYADCYAVLATYDTALDLLAGPV